MNLVHSTIFLEITLDKKLHWGGHTEKLANRLSSQHSQLYINMLINEVANQRTLCSLVILYLVSHGTMSYRDFLGK